MGRNVSVREIGIVIHPCLPWLAASPDGMVVDDGKVGLIEIKCPASKKNALAEELVNDPQFYASLENREPVLTRSHSRGYFSQVQLAMGLSGAKFCDFIVYTFKGVIIVRVRYEEIYFRKLVEKLSKFFKEYILPEIKWN